MSSAHDAAPLPAQGGVVERVGGALCLDFANTVQPRVSVNDARPPNDYLTDYGELVAWSLQAGAITPQQAEQLSTRGTRRPAAAKVALAQAIELREAIYRVFYAIASHNKPAAADLQLLSTAYAAAGENLQLVMQGERFAITWAGEPDDLARPLWPIARSAIDLLLDAEPARIKDCQTGGAGCGWLFYDTSKNNSRRWCSMRTCGGTDKERRRAQRRRAT